jgi:hypothetical protein
MLTNLVQKVPTNFVCDFCNYSTSRKSQYDRHILTSKHKKLTNNNKLSSESSDILSCKNCNKIYKSRVGLWNHKKKCIQNICKETQENIIDISDKNLILTLINQNNELQKQMLEIIKNNTNTNVSNSTNINSHNKTFNLQFFLNETCKDAMNIMDFVDSIKIQLADIESIGELGFVNGMSKLIIKNLKALDENMRPVHCSDPKRESLYVKDANVWEKEDSENKKIKKAIKYISHKNICAIPEWKAKYPDCIYSDSKKSNQYNHIVIESMGGSGDNDSEKADKIVKKIAKEITIDKNN